MVAFRVHAQSMKEPIFHIGYPKTATSWLQSCLFPYIKNASYIPRGESARSFIQCSHWDFDPDRVRDKFSKYLDNRLIFSLEGFIGTTHNFGLNGYMTIEHAQRIKSTYPEASIVLFIRRQTDIIASSYAQYLKGGGTHSIKKFLYHQSLRNLGGLMLFNWQYFEYHHVIRLYQDLFGSNKVHVFLFEDFLQNKRDFIESFCSSLGLEADISQISLFKVNPGYRRIIKWIALITNRFTERKMPNKYYLLHIPGWFRFSKKILLHLNRYKIFGNHLNSRDHLTRNIQKEIQEYYKKSNNILISEFNLERIKDFDYPC